MEMSIEGQEWDHERSYMSYYWVGFHPLVDGELLKKKLDSAIRGIIVRKAIFGQFQEWLSGSR